MISKAGTYMKFYYSKEATPVTVVTFGTKDISKDENKVRLVKSLSEFLVGDVAQKGFNLAGLGNGSSAMVTPDESAFNADWGVTMYPSQISNTINPPISVVAFDALIIWRDYYKRQKEINFCVDTSGSTKDTDMGADGPRIQLIDRAITTVSDPSWLSTNMVTPGDGDRITYRFFSTLVTPILTESIGKDTQKNGDYINGLIGPATGEYDPEKVDQHVQQTIAGYSSMAQPCLTVRKLLDRILKVATTLTSITTSSSNRWRKN
jgi:hypothetical protein